MSALPKLKQGTEEWHEHRKLFRNASESPIVMGLSPWMTPYQLWKIKTGRAAPQEATAPMKYGTEMEPFARAAYEEKTCLVMQPLVMTSGDYSASLDGITLDGDLIVEIKCPYKGKSSELWQAVEIGEVPEMYRIQIQHQLLVSGAKLAHLFVFDGDDGILLTIAPDQVAQQRIKNAWDDFVNYVATYTPPPLVDGDTVLRDDLDWQLAAELYVAAKSKSDEISKVMDEAKSKLISLAKHNRESGCGVVVTRFWKQGSVNYKAIPELSNVDLEKFRGKSKEEVRVTVVKP